MNATKQRVEADKKRREVENKFDILCNSIVSQRIVWDRCLNTTLGLKNEMAKHNIPPALLLKLTVTHSELYRSQADLLAPVSELVRLVSVYKQSLEEKSIALKRIDEENERRKVELDIAVKKLEQTYSYEKQWRRDHTLNNWERLFCKAALSRTHGRRWKFVISKVKQRAALGLSVFNPMIECTSDEEEFTAGIVAPRFTYGSTTNSTVALTKRSGFTSHYTTSVPPSTVATTKQSSGVQSSLMSSSLKLDTSGDTDDEEDTQSTEPMPAKLTKSPTPHKTPSVQRKRIFQTKDSSVSTEDIEHDKLLKIQVYNPIGFKLAHIDISCKLSMMNQTKVTELLDTTDEASYQEITFLFEGEKYKKLGYNRGTSIGALMEEEISEQLEVTVHHGDERKIFALSTIPIEDLSDSQPEVRDNINQEDVVPKPFPIFSLEGDVTAPCGYLPIFCVWQLIVRRKKMDAGTTTDELLFDDEEDEEMAEEELPLSKASPTSPALSRKSVSVKIPTPKPPSEPTTPEPTPVDCQTDKLRRSPSVNRDITEQMVDEIVKGKAQEMALSHAQEIERLQFEYELRINGMAKALEIMKLEQEESSLEYIQTPISMISSPSPARRPISSGVALRDIREGIDVPVISIKQRASASATVADNKKRRKLVGGNLLEDGRELKSANFFERMEHFTQSAMIRQRELIQRVRDEVRSHAEGAMATQNRLSCRTDSADSGINEATQDLSLPAIFMPSKTGVVYSSKAGKYFHPTGSRDPRLSQAPSVFQLPRMQQTPVLNLFDLSEKNAIQNGPGWLYKTCRDVTKNK